MSPYCWESMFLEEGDKLEASLEQEHLWDDYYCFDIAPIQDEVQLSLNIRVHKDLCDGKPQSTVLHVNWPGGGLVSIS